MVGSTLIGVKFEISPLKVRPFISCTILPLLLNVTIQKNKVRPFISSNSGFQYVVPIVEFYFSHDSKGITQSWGGGVEIASSQLSLPRLRPCLFIPIFHS